jgi:hypothetical protein
MAPKVTPLPYKRGTFEDYVGVRGYDRLGKKSWRQQVADVIGRLIAGLEPEDVVLGGGNFRRLKELPPGCRAGDNANAFLGGFRLWEQTGDRILPLPQRPVLREDRRRKEYQWQHS